MKRTPYTPKDFAWTKWTASDIKALVPKIIAEKKARLTTIKQVRPAERNFENTVYALEASGYGISDLILKIDLIQNVSPSEAVRKAANRAIETIEKQMLRIERDKGIWAALCEYNDGAWKSESANLDQVDKKLFHTWFLLYKRMGFGLATPMQRRLRAVEERLSKISNEFRQNINAYKDQIVVTEQEVADLPDRYKAGLARDKKGNHIVTLAYPDYVPFMELTSNEVRRKELSGKFLKKGGLKNLKVLEEMLALRAERAKLLGYSSHADFRTELRMSKSGKTALKFQMNLLRKVESSGRKDLAELRDLKRKMTANPKAELFSHDIAYYGHELQKSRFKFNSEELREYFPLTRVLEGTFKIYSTLFGVQFEKTKGFPLWHPDVELYATKTPQGETLSYFALDLHPRDGKYGHGAMFDTISGHTAAMDGTGTYTPPLAVIVVNFPKPSSTHPSLLSHNEVETILHEFGHAMHHTLTTAKYASQSGCGTAWDFVEAPSQMLEHWAWNKKSLALLSIHYKTGKSMPPLLLKNLLASKDHLLRYTTLTQLIRGIFDLKLHITMGPPEPARLYRTLVKKHTGIIQPGDSIFPAGFGHLEGYDAGYYGYMWANVYAADMFTRFEKEGILNKKTGADYKKWILEKGGSMEELDLVKGFLGRKPSNKAFLKEIGVRR